jgi:beta-fructofuranosidase
VQYYIGEYHDQKFTPQVRGRMNFTEFDGASNAVFTSGDLVAPICWKLADGRRVMIGWIAEGRREPVQRTVGWAGIMSLPRELTLREDGTLGIEPWPGLEMLRGDHQLFNEVQIESGEFVPLAGGGGTCLELAAVIDPGDSDEVGVSLLRSPDGEEETRVTYRPAQDSLTLDVARSSLSPQAAGRVPQTGPLRLVAGEMLALRIFVDRSVVEVFANGRQCLTKRVYPSRADSVGIGLFAGGGTATARSVDVWQMSAIWPVQSS